MRQVIFHHVQISMKIMVIRITRQPVGAGLHQIFVKSDGVKAIRELSNQVKTMNSTEVSNDTSIY